MKLTRLAAMGAVTIALALAFVAPVSATDNAKWFVCKYVGTPGVDEALQTGNNPISVSENAIPVSPVVAGASFRTRRAARTSSWRTPVRTSPTRQSARRRNCPRADADADAGGTPTPTPTPTPDADPDPRADANAVSDADSRQRRRRLEADRRGRRPGNRRLSFAAGWEFNLDTDATITDSEPVTGDGEPAWFQLKLSDSTGATVGEDLQDGYELIDAWCVNLGGLEVEPEAMSRFKAADTGELVGELDGDTVTFDVDPGTLYECVFVNTLVPEDSVGGETETPANTLPPTDTFGGPATPSNEGWVCDARHHGRDPRKCRDPDPEARKPPPLGAPPVRLTAGMPDRHSGCFMSLAAPWYRSTGSRVAQTQRIQARPSHFVGCVRL